MKISLIHNQELNFTAQGASGEQCHINASSGIGGISGGFRPMELFLVSLASCTSIDTILILNKSKKTYCNYQVKVEGKRREKIPKFFTEIDLYFSVESQELPFHTFHRAVLLSLTKYCSVVEMIRGDVKVRGHIELNGKPDMRVIEKVFLNNLD